LFLLRFRCTQAQDESQVAAGKPVADVSYLVLPGGTRMPLIGLGTYKIESPESIKKALEGGAADSASIGDGRRQHTHTVCWYAAGPHASVSFWSPSKH
jgi:hypothetical protein